MLKYENTAQLSDRIRAYDFMPMQGRNPDYIEGMVMEITDERGYKAFKIFCDADVWDGQPCVDSGSRIGKFVFVPMETSHDYDGRIVKL